MRWKLYDEEYGSYDEVVIKPRLDEHAEKVATATELGHIKVDNNTITSDSDGKIKVSDAYGDNLLSESKDYTDSQITTLNDSKVDKVEGKQLSTEDFTTALKNKLESLDPGGGGTGTLADVAYSGEYDDLLNKPTLGTVSKLDTEDVLSNQFEVADEQSMLLLDLKRGDTVVRIDQNKTYIAKTDNVNSISDFMEIKSPSSVTPVTSVNGRLGDIVLGKSDVGLSEVTNESKLSMFDNPHFTGIPTADTATTNNNSKQLATTEFVHNVVDGKQYTKADIGLGNVDNTSDLDKPISIATQNALNDKADKSVVNTLSSNFTTLQNNFNNHLTANNAHTIGQISELRSELDREASVTELGRVKIDGTTITISNGVISASGGGTSLNWGEWNI